MARAAGASVVALLAMAAAVCPGGAHAGDATPPKKPAAGTPAASAPPATAPAASASVPAPTPPPAPRKRLRLGPYVDPPGPVPVEHIFDLPHFETRVEVQGKAMDSAALTARMEWWMRDFEPRRGSVPRGGSAPSLEEIREYRPHPADSVNIVPILDWLVDKLNKKD
jgi:hypothetical protein